MDGKNRNRCRWSEEEIQYLITHCKRIPYEQIAHKLGRTIVAVKSMAYTQNAAEHRKAKGKPTLCWDCKNATGGCSWSKKLVPVAGWEVIPATVYNSNKTVHSYNVRHCPLFERG